MTGVGGQGFVLIYVNSHDTKWLWKGKREKFYMQCF